MGGLDYAVWIRDLGVQWGSGENRAGLDEGPEIVLWFRNSTSKNCRDGGPTSQVVGEDTVCVVLE